MIVRKHRAIIFLLWKREIQGGFKMENATMDRLITGSDFYHVVQPIINLSKDQVHGYEVLLRSERLQSPESLFNYAKDQNKLFDLDMKAIYKAFTTFKTEKTHLENVYLFINIFPSTLMDPAFNLNLQRIKSALKIQPNLIVFEINEAEKVKNFTALKEAILDLKEQGFLIALDDIGKGESTLPAILELEPDVAKIDRYFAKDLTNSPKKQKVIKLMLELFGDDTTVIVEGFECEADLLSAKELGVPLGQGFFLGRPNPLEYYL